MEHRIECALNLDRFCEGPIVFEWPDDDEVPEEYLDSICEEEGWSLLDYPSTEWACESCIRRQQDEDREEQAYLNSYHVRYGE